MQDSPTLMKPSGHESIELDEDDEDDDDEDDELDPDEMVELLVEKEVELWEGEVMVVVVVSLTQKSPLRTYPALHESA
jgi:hypothetical protein